MLGYIRVNREWKKHFIYLTHVRREIWNLLLPLKACHGAIAFHNMYLCRHCIKLWCGRRSQCIIFPRHYPISKWYYRLDLGKWRYAYAILSLLMLVYYSILHILLFSSPWHVLAYEPLRRNHLFSKLDMFWLSYYIVSVLASSHSRLHLGVLTVAQPSSWNLQTILSIYRWSVGSPTT